MKQVPTCPNCGSPMWRVVVEDSIEATSHFECFFHIDESCARVALPALEFPSRAGV